DSTVVEADVRSPTDIGLCGDAVRTLARAARAVRRAVPRTSARVRDRARAVGRRVRALTRTLRHRSGEAKAAVQRHFLQLPDFPTEAKYSDDVMRTSAATMIKNFQRGLLLSRADADIKAPVPIIPAAVFAWLLDQNG
ncbi:MAG TPA: hypothetical protein VFC31_14110, partial [Candidatus Limnocylindria bacterium]|nr:hypothetical protein [Candidatus Limnocylindria bacterium]